MPHTHIETLKSVILVLLFCLMIFLSAYYIVSTQWLTAAGSDTLDLNRLLIVREETSASFDASLVLPDAVCYTLNGIPHVCMSDADILGDIYDTVSDALIVLLGSSSAARTVSEEEGEQLWQAAIRANNSIYLRFFTQLPAPVLLACLEGGITSSGVEYAEGGLFNITEMFIVLEPIAGNACQYHGVARDSSGSTAVFTPTEQAKTLYDITALSTFNANASVIGGSFSARTETDYGLPLTDTTLITGDHFSGRLIGVSCGITEETRGGLLRLFGYNPDRLNRYTENDGNTVYVETFGNMRLSDTGLQYEGSEENGLAVSSLLGYENYSMSYNLYELLNASCALYNRLRQIDAGLAGGKASPVLLEIGTAGRDVTFRFGMVYDGILLYDAGYTPLTAYEVTFSSSCVKAASVSFLHVSVTGSSVTNFGQEWTMNKIAAGLTDPAPGTIRLVYLVADFTGKGTYSPEWIYVYRPAA